MEIWHSGPDGTVIKFTDIDLINLYQALSTQLKPEYTNPGSATAAQLSGMKDLLKSAANAAFNR